MCEYRTVFCYLRAGTPQLAVARLLSLLRAEWFSATAPNSASHFVCRQNAPAVSKLEGEQRARRPRCVPHVRGGHTGSALRSME